LGECFSRKRAPAQSMPACACTVSPCHEIDYSNLLHTPKTVSRNPFGGFAKLRTEKFCNQLRAAPEFWFTGPWRLGDRRRASWQRNLTRHAGENFCCATLLAI